MTSWEATIEAYLADLAGRLRQWRIEPGPIIQEARDHLLCEVERARTTSAEEAAASAVRYFGDAETVASRWALMRRAEHAREASRAMTRRLIVIALLGHLAAFALPALITGAAVSGEGTLLAELRWSVARSAASHCSCCAGWARGPMPPARGSDGDWLERSFARLSC